MKSTPTSRMNQLKSGDDIKVLAVTIFDDQNAKEFFACQDGATLIRMILKNPLFKTIPYRTLFYAQGKIKPNRCTDESITIEVDFEKDDQRFISLNPDTIKLYQGLSVFDILESFPSLSDGKPFPDRIEFEGLYLFQLKRHAHFVKIIRDELECGDFGDTTPKYIKGSAYKKLFHGYKERIHEYRKKFSYTSPQKEQVTSKKRIVRRKNQSKLQNRAVSHVQMKCNLAKTAMAQDIQTVL